MLQLIPISLSIAVAILTLTAIFSVTPQMFKSIQCPPIESDTEVPAYSILNSATLEGTDDPQAVFLYANPDTHALYLAEGGTPAIHILDTDTLAQTAQFDITGFPNGLFFNKLNNKIYVIDDANTEVQVYDGTTFESIANVTLLTNAVQSDPDLGTNLMYIAESNGGTNSYQVLDMSTDTIIGEGNATGTIFGIAHDDLTSQTYLVAVSDDTTNIYNSTNQQTGTKSTVSGKWVDVDEAGDFFYVLAPQAQKLYVFDRLTTNLVESVDLFLNDVLTTFMVVEPNEHLLFFSDDGGRSMQVYSTVTNEKVAGPANLGAVFYNPAFDPQREIGYVYDFDTNSIVSFNLFDIPAGDPGAIAWEESCVNLRTQTTFVPVLLTLAIVVVALFVVTKLFN